MRRAVWSLLFGVGLLTVWLTRPASKVNAGAVSCMDVISRINHVVSEEHGRAPSVPNLAKQLGTTPAWVEHCMRVYGRHPNRPDLEVERSHENRLEEFESAEPEESVPEDVEEPGAHLRKVHPEKHPRQPPPTIGLDDKE